jgi:NADH-quinone oxidoreductase subunit L
MHFEIALALTIIALPLMSFALVIFLGGRAPGKGAYLPIAAMGIDLVLAIVLLGRVIGGFHGTADIPWFDIGWLHVTFSVALDPLASVMLLVVTTVSFLVHVYSTGYMHGDPRYSRYFAFLSLFSFSMLGLVLAASFFIIFIFWELVGLSSYLLIGFWFEKKSASDAGKKAFITTRTGDLGFMVGIFLIYGAIGSFTFADAFKAVHSGAISGTLLTAAAICIFSGAVGKSAQFPLHVWLPDAMEGPTPVSALIHAATMVAAGVYLVARCAVIFAASDTGGMTVAVIGGWTAFFAATIACTQYDIKRVLAYSTLSQLGFMMLALGVGGYGAGMFHLATHASFKALLFLGAGSVIHAVHAQDIREMGGLRKSMPVTAVTFILASLALAGIPPLSGFWSKDEILLHVKHDGPTALYVLASAAAFMTAFYMARLCFLVFFGEPRGKTHAHESPRSMTIPLIVLATLSVVAGWVNIPHVFEGFSRFVHFEGAHHLEFSWTVAVISTALALGGLTLGAAMYYWKSVPVDFLSRRFPPIYKLLYNKWYVDEIYGALVIRPLLALTRGLFRFDLGVIDGAVNGMAWLTVLLSKIKRWFDVYIVDGAVNGIGWLTNSGSSNLRRVQSGHVQEYALAILLGVITMAVLALFV